MHIYKKIVSIIAIFLFIVFICLLGFGLYLGDFPLTCLDDYWPTQQNILANLRIELPDSAKEIITDVDRTGFFTCIITARFEIDNTDLVFFNKYIDGGTRNIARDIFLQEYNASKIVQSKNWFIPDNFSIDVSGWTYTDRTIIMYDVDDRVMIYVISIINEDS